MKKIMNNIKFPKQITSDFENILAKELGEFENKRIFKEIVTHENRI